jgi:hypothetical protein
MRNKTFLLLLILGFLSSTIGCKKDSEELTCGEKLEGTWRARSIVYDGVEIFGPSKLIQVLEIEFWNFNVVDAEGKSRARFEPVGGTSSVWTNTYKPSNSCSRVTLPDFWCGADLNATYSFDIDDLSDERLILKINYSRGVPSCDGNLTIDLEKIK